MDICLDWLNTYLDPGDVTADEADRVLTEAGLPIEERKISPDGTVVLDVEVTSNRGDCLSHVGCAREIAANAAASKARRLLLPAAADVQTGPPIADALTLENREPGLCPLFTARLIRGVGIGPSPDWLRRRIESLGHHSINNVVDVTNFITFETGNPCHVFDLAKMKGSKVVVRFARAGERIKTLYAGEHTLRDDDLVVADAERPQSLAGIIGGHDAQVDDATTDVIFEMATWSPGAVRRTGRRYRVATDARHRFERIVDPRTIDAAARRAVALICDVSGGRLASGVLEDGADLPLTTVVELRPTRCDAVLGIATPVGRMIELLRALEIDVEQTSEDVLRCAVPPHRPDLTREIDLIEEVGRTRGLGDVPVVDTLPIRVGRPQQSERAVRAVGGVLAGLGFFETVTFSFASDKAARPWYADGLEPVGVDDDRRKAEPILRPSLVPALLACRASNQNAGADVPGGIRLFEIASVFAQKPGTRDTLEHTQLALLVDALGAGRKRAHEDVQMAARALRGAVEAVARVCFGSATSVRVVPATPDRPAWDPDAHARVAVAVAGRVVPIGVMGLPAPEVLRPHDLEAPVVAAELDLAPLVEAFPPPASAAPLPAFPDTDRDISFIVDEATPYGAIEQVLGGLALERLESAELVGVFRGTQIGTSRKSVTVRLVFRDPARTLRREEVDPDVERFIAAAKAELGAEVRT